MGEGALKAMSSYGGLTLTLTPTLTLTLTPTLTLNPNQGTLKAMSSYGGPPLMRRMHTSWLPSGSGCTTYVGVFVRSIRSGEKPRR